MVNERVFVTNSSASSLNKQQFSDPCLAVILISDAMCYDLWGRDDSGAVGKLDRGIGVQKHY